jgi:hypothetical protein
VAFSARFQVLIYHSVQSVDCAFEFCGKKIRVRSIGTGKRLSSRPLNRLLPDGIKSPIRQQLVKLRDMLANDRFEREKSHLVLNRFFAHSDFSIAESASPSA